MTSQKQLAGALTLLALTMGVSAFGGVTSRERVQYVDEPVARIYNRGADNLDRRRWPQALAAFEEVERQHPYSSWARRAER